MTSTPHKVEIELTNTVGMQSPADRDPKSMERFRMNLLEQVDKVVEDDEFDALSTKSQQWVNLAIDAVIGGNVAPDFDAVDDEEEKQEVEAKASEDIEQSDEVEVDDTPEQERNTVKDEEAAPEANEVPATTESAPTLSQGAKPKTKSGTVAKTRKFFGVKDVLQPPKKISGGYRAKELMIKHGFGVEDDLIMREVRKEGLRIGAATLQTIRYEFKQNIVLLHENGLLNEKAFDKMYGKGDKQS